MLDEFVRFVEGIFPSIDPYVAERATEAIRQHRFESHHLYEVRLLPQVSQADIIGPLPFFLRSNLDELRRYDGPGLMLSNTCDVENDDHAVCCAAFEVEVFEERFTDGEMRSLRRNEKFNLLYLPGVPNRGDLVVDLSICNTVPRHLLTGDDEGDEGTEEIPRIASLSQLGYYFFLSKLTVHLMRPEAEEVDRTEVLAGLGQAG